MAEFIPHKIQVSVAGSGYRHQPDHFMERHAPIDPKAMVENTHRSIDILVDQTEKNGFIPYHSLIVTFGITDGMLFRTFVGQFVKHIPDMPLLIFFIFDQFDPIIRYSHAHTKIET